MGLFVAAHKWEEQKVPFQPPKICHKFRTMMKPGSYTSPKEDPKNI